METKEITFVTIAGVDIPAYKVICPECHVLDLGTIFVTHREPWTAICTKGHEWRIALTTDT